MRRSRSARDRARARAPARPRRAGRRLSRPPASSRAQASLRRLMAVARGERLALIARIDAILGWLTARWWRLLLVGLVVAGLGLVELNRSHPAPFTIQSGRAVTMQRTLASLERGDPIGTERQTPQDGL